MFFKAPTIFNTLLFLTIGLGLMSSAFGQQKQITGKIENEVDREGIHILNKTSRYNAITNAEGIFSITVKPLDTLLISSITYVPEEIVISNVDYDNGYISITLEALVNELDEVFLGPKLTGNLEQDIKTIKTEEMINFDDVGIPGFKGVPEEKIPNMLGQVITPLSVNIEGLYKHLSGYYKKLRIRRKWQAQNVTVSQMIHLYGVSFFMEAYKIPEERIYDFLLFCMETSNLQSEFKKENFANVLTIFSEKSVIYVDRLATEKQ